MLLLLVFETFLLWHRQMKRCLTLTLSDGNIDGVGSWEEACGRL
jgi:hypothetical protein